MADFMCRFRIPIRDPFPHNVVMQRCERGEVRAVFVDGLKNPAFLPVAAWIAPVAWRQVEKKLKRLSRGAEKIRRVEAGQTLGSENGILLRQGQSEDAEEGLSDPLARDVVNKGSTRL